MLNKKNSNFIVGFLVGLVCASMLFALLGRRGESGEGVTGTSASR